MITIRPCVEDDVEAIHALINESAGAYQGVIPDDCWKQPYMSLGELRREIELGVRFWGAQEEKDLVGVMGTQSVEDLSLIRHAYVLTSKQRQKIGFKLLSRITKQDTIPQLVGTWTAARWAIHFYQKHGFRLVPASDKERLLKRYWSIPERQVEASVVLVDGPHFEAIVQPIR